MTKKVRSAPRRRLKKNADSRWLGARRALLARYKRQARALEGPEPPALAAYRERHSRALQGRWRPSAKAELLARLALADVALGGDFHSLPQAQRAHLRVLRALPPGREATVAMEAFSASAQRSLERFLVGEIDLPALRKASRWDRDWGFPWESYGEILELARARGWRVLALGPRRGAAELGLKKRDAFAAELIAREAAARPSALVYVIFGELHLAPSHLPSAILAAARKAGAAAPRLASIHLNSERIYFALARAGLDSSVDVARLGEDRFCLIATPPWVQWQAHWLHLEKSIEPGLAAGADGFDYTDHVAEIVRLAAADLGVEAELGAGGRLGSDLSVYSSEDGRIWDWLNRRLRKRHRLVAAALIAEGRSFYLPSEGVFYLARATLNHASELAGQYVHAKLSGRRRWLWDMPGDFESAVWRDAVGFLASKLMNPQRRADTLADARARLLALGPGDRGREALLLALDQRMRELVAAQQPASGLSARARRRRRSRALSASWPQARRQPKRAFRPRRKSSWREAARILGAMMGERLYAAARSRSISLEGIVELLRMGFDSPGFARTRYPELVRLLGPRFEPRDPMKERL
jgi:hypothetical protein